MFDASPQQFGRRGACPLRPVAPTDVLGFLEEQLKRLSNADSGGILTIGILGAIWSSSVVIVAIVSSLNRAHDIEEGRPWWEVRLTAIGLTIAIAVLVLLSVRSAHTAMTCWAV